MMKPLSFQISYRDVRFHTEHALKKQGSAIRLLYRKQQSLQPQQQNSCLAYHAAPNAIIKRVINLKFSLKPIAVNYLITQPIRLNDHFGNVCE